MIAKTYDRKIIIAKHPIFEEPVNPLFHPSPTMRVHFDDGTTIAMNRQERRRAHLYGDRIKVVKR